ncbi:MAG: formyltransferase family protein [Bacteroidota bacterium]|jgi:methionyl-tRNA formyltransferase
MIENKITLFLMGLKGYSVLKSIIENEGGNVIDCVITALDQNTIDDSYEKIISLCKKNNIPMIERNAFIEVKTEYSIAISWRWLINIQGKLIVLHDSLLPKYRGFAPLVSSLINGEKKIGVTAILANKHYDEGPILGQDSVLIEYPIKIEEAINIISQCYKRLSLSLVGNIVNRLEFNFQNQNENEATYSLWLNEDDYRIDWDKDAHFIKRFIDSVGYPYKGASTVLNGVLVRILDAEEEDEIRIENRKAGKIIFVKNKQPVVVCGKGLLRITILKSEDLSEDILPLKQFRLKFL